MESVLLRRALRNHILAIAPVILSIRQGLNVETEALLWGVIIWERTRRMVFSNAYHAAELPGEA